jgi:hypothetical protein
VNTVRGTRAEKGAFALAEEASKPRSPASRKPKAAGGKTGTAARTLARRPRKRAVKTPASEVPADLSGGRARERSAVRGAVRQREQIVMLAAAIVLGLAGLAVHVLWLAAIVLMSVLLGLIAADMRVRGGGGVVNELVAGVKSIAGNGTDGVEPQGEDSTSELPAATEPPTQ